MDFEATPGNSGGSWERRSQKIFLLAESFGMQTVGNSRK